MYTSFNFNSTLKYQNRVLVVSLVYHYIYKHAMRDYSFGHVHRFELFNWIYFLIRCKGGMCSYSVGPVRNRVSLTQHPRSSKQSSDGD
jgi:hypothetical protein